jgi:hypothetical protein
VPIPHYTTQHLRSSEPLTKILTTRHIARFIISFNPVNRHPLQSQSSSWKHFDLKTEAVDAR